MAAERPWKSIARAACLALVVIVCGWQAIRAQAPSSDREALKEHQARGEDQRTLVDERSAPGSTTQAAGDPKPVELPVIDLQSRIKDLKVKSTPQGEVVRVRTDDGDVDLTPAQLVRAIGATQTRVHDGGIVFRLFNISKPASFVWISVGLLGQVMFTFRMVLQWWASEKHKRSIIPVGFWWGSLLGGLMLFAYFCWRKDVVGIIGQSTGVFIYARNLMLIYSGKRIEAEGARPAEHAGDDESDGGAMQSADGNVAARHAT